MSKSERLFDLLTVLRSKRYAVTATELAKVMNVSERTIYRDIQSLQNSGVPIQGETGVGYMLQAGSHLPPLMLTEQEMVAFELGMRMVRAWSDEELAKAAQSASTKIQSVLPDRVKKQIESFPMAVADNHIPSDIAKRGQLLRHAIDKQHKVSVHYITEDGLVTERVLQPLGQIFWGNNWTLVAWCEQSDDYRHFHLDRIEQLSVLEEAFSLTESKSLPHCLSLCVNSHLV
ncbi:helix-turn-helix transcriptional regulator [Vibrio sp. 10N.261.46.E12]|uniref:helix-turn-helix transcriptional regulator n=1 Tax=unclassified Vibrio TaxID=2614977 RepID=UPI000977DC74|nr:MULTISPECIES: YafY family protein [unclassified Vibrio]OMO34805.1 DNA-binding transcriptional regulator [Vibrio sp. 10N.261.45.E1]PMJ33812.1 DNA-binding transcriptional regulator [Vibrio sp. 10N.286.45.B6]PML86422.1 DNA-binding transcriptional regulator [Vibrio sp. 10N.261.49.E11]PMM68068.1 DNA-binding transcriptional regulator [Vibrio sp. 10N.261.46.F12]PMM90479.1 DNA-binding transcriptional regulator [Vibrio sp. 10N.261.46.E8]